MDRSDFSSKKLATLYGFGYPRSSCVHLVSVLCFAVESDAPRFVTTSARAPTPTKQAALRLCYVGVVLHRPSAAAPSSSMYPFFDLA